MTRIPDYRHYQAEPPQKRDWRATLEKVARNPWAWVAAIVVILLSLGGDGAGDILVGAVGAVGIVVLYFLPSLIARKKHNASSVFVINLFFGWTLIGWVIALSMAANNPPAQQVVVQSPTAVTQAQALGGRTCPFCAEDIKPAAIVCKHCGRDLPPPEKDS